MKVLLFIFMASIGQGSAAPEIKTVELPSMASCKRLVGEMQDHPKPGKGYTQYTYLCSEVTP